MKLFSNRLIGLLHKKEIQRTIVSGLLILCLTATASFAQIRGKVVGVHDGDTFTLLTDEHHTIKVRLYGVDAPEIQQDFAQKSKNFLADQIFQQYVWVKSKGKDRYKRVLGIVYKNPQYSGFSINEQSIKLGYTWHFTKYDRNPAWSKLEEEARRNRLNIWGSSNPIAPWEYRKSKRKT